LDRREWCTSSVRTIGANLTDPYLVPLPTSIASIEPYLAWSGSSDRIDSAIMPNPHMRKRITDRQPGNDVDNIAKLHQQSERCFLQFPTNRRDGVLQFLPSSM
jgi:hypothetical protein